MRQKNIFFVLLINFETKMNFMISSDTIRLGSTKQAFSNQRVVLVFINDPMIFAQSKKMWHHC